MTAVTPDYLIDTFSLHEAIAYFAVFCRIDISVFVDPPVNELSNPRTRIRVTCSPKSVSNAVGITVTRREVFELVIFDVCYLVYEDVGVFLTLEAFFESDSFEDAIRNAISIGGDSDTIAAIAGAVAGAYYGIPNQIKAKVSTFLDRQLAETLRAFKREFVL